MVNAPNRYSVQEGDATMFLIVLQPGQKIFENEMIEIKKDSSTKKAPATCQSFFGTINLPV